MDGFARYGLPGDDLLARIPDAVITPISGSTEDPAYLISNWLARRPSKPSKLLETNGGWDFDLLAATNVAAFGAIYHNFDEGLPVELLWSSNAFSTIAGSQQIVIPPWTEDGWSVSPWIEVTGSPTYRYWRLLITSSPGNSYPLSLGRPVFLGALRDQGNDVRFGIVENEDHKHVEMGTFFDVETIYNVGDKRRALNGEIALRDEPDHPDSQAFISLVRSANGRYLPWYLVPDADVNDIWMVRFVDSGWERTQDFPNNNVFPFRVRELSRGWPFPGPTL